MVFYSFIITSEIAFPVQPFGSDIFKTADSVGAISDNDTGFERDKCSTFHPYQINGICVS